MLTYYFRALQVKDEVFERIQEEHFDRLRRCLDDRKAAFEILCGNSQMDEADKLLNLSEEDPLPKSVMTTLRRYRKPVAEMPNNPDHDQNERKEIENSGSSFIFSVCNIPYAAYSMLYVKAFVKLEKHIIFQFQNLVMFMVLLI